MYVAGLVIQDMNKNLEGRNKLLRLLKQYALAGLHLKRLVNPLNAELNPICYLLALLGAHNFLHVSRIRVKSLTLRLLMSYIY